MDFTTKTSTVPTLTKPIDLSSTSPSYSSATSTDLMSAPATSGQTGGVTTPSVKPAPTAQIQGSTPTAPQAAPVNNAPTTPTPTQIPTTNVTGMTDAQVRALAGNDFTGFQLQKDGTYIPDSYAQNKYEVTATGSPLYTPAQKAQMQMDAKQKADAEHAQYVQDQITGIQNDTIPLNAGQQAQLDGLRQQFQNLITQQQQTNIGAKGYANVSGYQSGAAEYDPTFQARTIGTIVSAGLQKVATLNSEMASALARMTEGFKTDNINAVKDAYKIYTDASERRQTELQKTIDDAQSKIVAAQKAQADIQKQVNDIAMNAAQNGASPATISAINSAGSVGAAIAAAGDSLQKATGDAGDYLFYRNQARTAGVTPLSYDAWYAKKQQTAANAEYAKAFASAKGKAAGEAAVAGAGGVSGSPYAGVIGTILASGNFTKQQTDAIKNGIANGEDPMTVIKNNAKNILGSTEATKLTNYEQSKAAMSDLNNALNEYYANGGSTGILSGKYEDAIAKLGKVNDPALRNIATQISAALQIYRNAVSGTAYSVQEGSQIQSIFPGIDNTKGLNDAIIAGRMKAFDSVIDNTYRTALGSAYDKLKDASRAADPIQEEKDAKSTIDSYIRTNPTKLQSIAPLINAGKTNAQVIDYMKLHPEVYGTI